MNYRLDFIQGLRKEVVKPIKIQYFINNKFLNKLCTNMYNKVKNIMSSTYE